MAHTFPELVIGGVLLAPFVAAFPALRLRSSRRRLLAKAQTTAAADWVWCRQLAKRAVAPAAATEAVPSFLYQGLWRATTAVLGTTRVQ